MRLIGAVLGVCALICIGSARATPIAYDVVFDTRDADHGLDGTGSFIWHDDLQTITNFVWTFGDGLSGGFYDEQFDGIGAYAFAVFGGEGTTRANCAIGTINCRLPTDPAASFGFPLSAFSYFEFTRLSDTYAQFFLHDPVHWAGQMIVTKQVPEPDMVGLMLAGLAAAAIARRRRQSKR
jgi:hypothetical protein